jgi:N-acetylneuraminate synthase
MAEIRRRYGCPTGLSDHSGTIYAGLGAAALGAEILEVHIVFSRECFGPDVPASVTTAELKQLVEGVRFLERALQHPVDKDAEAETMGQIRRMFGKSVVAARRIEAGQIVDETMIAFKKPGDGLPPAEAARLLGRRAKRRLEPDELILEEDVEP